MMRLSRSWFVAKQNFTCALRYYPVCLGNQVVMNIQTLFSGVVPRVDLLDINVEPTDDELAALMHAAGNAARAVMASNKILVAARLAQAIQDLATRDFDPQDLVVSPGAKECSPG
jgi:hypothetical protein